MSNYDFGYSWWILNGHIVPLVLFGVLGGLAVWRRWPAWSAIVCGLLALWSVFAIVFLRSLNQPLTIPTTQFAEADARKVLDVGAGSGRAAIGVLLTRPSTEVTALDVYDGYFGIEGNTPNRLIANARIAGVADRIDACTGDMRAMPFSDGEFDAVISSYAVDHIPRRDVPKALGEIARVLKPGGELLLMIVHVDGWIRALGPTPLLHHFRQNPDDWTTALERAGFTMAEQGTQPATFYFLASRTGGAVAPATDASRPPRQCT